MNLRALWAFARSWYAEHSARDRRIIGGVGIAVGLSLVYVGVVEPLRGYRRRVAEEISEGHDRLERAARFVAAVDTLRAERAELKKRLAEAQGRLTLEGSARSASDLIAALEKSKHFHNVSFTSPTTKAGDKERFSIVAEVAK